MEMFLLRSNEEFLADLTVARESLRSSDDYPDLLADSSSRVIVKLMILELLMRPPRWTCFQSRGMTTV